jgi:macrolide-specific efflux system membrane fusion protein
MNTRRTRPWHLYLLALVGVALAVAAVSEIGAPTSSARTAKQEVTAEKGVVQSTVSGSGNVEAGTDVTVDFQTSGTLSRVYVKKGQHVAKGQLLATLDPTSARLTLKQAEKTLTSAKDSLSVAKNGSTSTSTSLNTTSSSNATELVDYATTSPTYATTLTTTTAPATTTTTTTATSTVTTPTTTTGSTPTTTGSTPTTTGTTPTLSTTTSSSSAPTTTTPSTAGTGSAASGAGATTTTSSASSIASAEASVYSAEASVTSAETALRQTKLYAPDSGTIVSLESLSPGDSVSSGTSSTSSSTGSSSSNSTSSSGSSTAGSLGSTGSSTSSSSSSTSSFAEIINTHKLTMTVAFSESDISKVKVGQAATVTLEALTGVELAAHVSAISAVGTTSSSVVSYDATLILDQHDKRVKAGMSASASVITGQSQGVTVPNDAVTGTGSLATVSLQRGNKTVQRQVVVGLKGDSRTTIISGLKAGDQLVVTSSLPSATSGSSSSGSSGSSGTLGGTGGGGGFPGGGGGFSPPSGGGIP